MSAPAFTLEQLADIVCDLSSSDEAKRLAITIAYRTGLQDQQIVDIRRTAERHGLVSPV